MTAAWLFAAFLAGAAAWPVLRAFVNRAADLTSPTLAETLWLDLVEAQWHLADERDRSDEMAARLAAYHWACPSKAGGCVDCAVLAAHEAARAAEVQR